MELRKRYPMGLLNKLYDELHKEQDRADLAPIDLSFMREVMDVRPSLLSKEEIDIKSEIMALRLRKGMRALGLKTCQ